MKYKKIGDILILNNNYSDDDYLNLSKKMKIKLLIDCQHYPLNIRREDEQLYRDAAKLIDNALNYYRRLNPDLSSNNYWAMTALEFAFHFLSMKDKNDTHPYLEKIEELTKELDNYISKK